MIGNHHIIYWDVQNRSTYMPGTDMTMTVDGIVLYENAVIPSGTIVHQWESQKSFSPTAETVQLPMLEVSKNYTISANLKVLPHGTAFLKIEFFDAFHHVLKAEHLYLDEIGSVTVPDQMDHYSIKLINAGFTQLEFSNLIISETDVIQYNVEEYTVSEVLNSDAESSAVHVLFVEPEPNYLSHIHLESLHLPNLIVVTSTYRHAHLYIRERLVKKLRKMTRQLISSGQVSEVHCLGYGPVSNFAALYYSKRWEDAKASITSRFWPQRFYQERYELYADNDELSLSTVLERSEDMTSGHVFVSEQTRMAYPVLQLEKFGRYHLPTDCLCDQKE